MNPSSHALKCMVKIVGISVIYKLCLKYRKLDDDPKKVYRATVVKAEDARKMLQFAVGEGRSVTLGLVEQS
jgi:hypothetical protein